MNHTGDVVKQLEQWLQRRIKTVNHRQLLVILGDESFCHTLAEKTISQQPDSTYLWLGHREKGPSIHIDQFRQFLGTEVDTVILSAFEQFSINAFLGVSGMIKRNGLFVVIAPSYENWVRNGKTLASQSYGFTNRTSRFIAYLYEHFNADPFTAIIEQKEDTLQVFLPTASVICDNQKAGQDRFSLTPEQQAIAHRLVAITNSHESFVTFLTGKRGRGKSWLLGWLAQQLIHNNTPVTVVAPQSASIRQVFNHTDQVRDRKLFQFIPPDSERLQDDLGCIVLIDEAAAIPLPRIKTIISANPRCLLCSTVDGYEGTATGILQRLLPFVHKSAKTMHHFSLGAPLRFNKNDPIETFSEGLFRVDTKTYSEPLKTIDNLDSNQIIFSELDVLSDNLEDIQQIFQLLRTAHYQTTPNDFVRMLDATDNQLVVLRYESRIIAVALLTNEGGESLQSLAVDIASGKRRVPGHMSVQLLAYQTASHEIIELKAVRISRIAVIPELQGKGLGGLLINQIQTLVTNQGTDILTTVFGATDPLKQFWQKQLFTEFALFGKANKASGLANTLFYKSLSNKSSEICASLLTLSPEQRIRKCRQFINGTRNLDSIRKDLPHLKDTMRNEPISEPLRSALQKPLLNENDLVKIAKLKSKKNSIFR